MKKRLLQPLRFVGIFLLILLYMGHAFVLSLWFGRKDPYRLRDHLTSWLQSYSFLGLKVLGVRVRLLGEPLTEGEQLVVSNHLTYLDVLVLSSQKAGCFVTSEDIRRTTFLGQIVELAGCLFVDRKSRQNLAREIHQLTEALQAGLSVMVFPEATSTNGEGVLRFRRPLFNASLLSGRPVQPLCINYVQLGGEPTSVQNRDAVFWYGDMPFASHLWAMCGLGEMEVELTVLPPLDPSQAEAGAQALGLASADEWLASQAHQAVQSAYKPLREEPFLQRPAAIQGVRPPEASL